MSRSKRRKLSTSLESPLELNPSWLELDLPKPQAGASIRRRGDKVRCEKSVGKAWKGAPLAWDLGRMIDE